MVEICAKILQIMRNNFKDYARTFCQLCAPFSALYYTQLAFNNKKNLLNQLTYLKSEA